VAKDRSTITNALRLVNLPEEIKDALRGGTITTGHARAILMVESPLDKRAFLEKIVTKGLSVREAEQMASSARKDPAPRKKADQHLESLSSLLSERFSTHVVCTWGKRKGKIIIDVSSKEDMRRIVEELSRYDETPI